MKKILFCNYYDELNKNNFMFENYEVGIGDSLLMPMFQLKEYAKAKGITVATVGSCDLRDADAIVFMDMPEKENKYFCDGIELRKPLYLMVLESKLVRQSNYDKANEGYFNKIFTYDDSLIDNIKYFKLNYTYLLPENISKDISNKKKLCVMIAGNKTISHPLELYSKRVEAIRWFEKNHPEDFDLFGIGWNEFSSPQLSFLNKIRLFKPLAAKQFPSYRGKVERKKPILEQYRFSICYENARDIPGYITEKLFDCFFAGCVPVYWGANNVLEHIPKGCFIDRRNFSSYEDLYYCLKNMNDDGYIGYLDNIENFLRSDKARQFSCHEFAETLLAHIAFSSVSSETGLA